MGYNIFNMYPKITINKEIFPRHKVKVAYLFGSQAKGNACQESDFDVAVLFKKNPPDPMGIDETTYLSLDLDKFFPAKLDIISLNDAPLLLKYEVVAHNQILYSENEPERIEFEVSVIKEYIDEEPLRKLYRQSFHKQILGKG